MIGISNKVLHTRNTQGRIPALEEQFHHQWKVTKSDIASIEISELVGLSHGENVTQDLP